MNSSTSSSEARPAASPGSGSAAYLAWYAAATALLACALAAFNWRVDPLQIHRAAGYAPVYIENQRYQNPGLARTQPYETVIVGTSHAENILPSAVERTLGERAVKLAISGSSAREQRLVLETAIRTGRVDHVIWILDHIAFKKPVDAVGQPGAPFPSHLYADGPADAIPYWLSVDTFELSLRALAGLGVRDLESLNAWWDDHEFGEGRVLADWRRRGALFDAFNRNPATAYGSTLERSRQGVLANLLPVLEANPGIRFDLVFPPYSVLSYLADHRMSDVAFAERQAYKAFVVQAVAGWPNVRVFDFQAHLPITHDLARYKDLEHYDIEVNEYVLRSLAQGRHLVTPENMPSVLAEQARQVEVYRQRVCRPGSARPGLCPRVAGASR